MQEDFHYYATYCAAYMAGYTHSECMDICYSAQFVDLCSMTLLHKIKAPAEAATTQLQLELMDTRTDIVGLQNITRIWSSFHFLPRDLNVTVDKRPKAYMNKYRLICGPDGELVKKTAVLAKGKSLQAAGIAMHVIADTWAHAYFAGTPSLAINNTTDENEKSYLINQLDGINNAEIGTLHSICKKLLTKFLKNIFNSYVTLIFKTIHYANWGRYSPSELIELLQQKYESEVNTLVIIKFSRNVYM